MADGKCIQTRGLENMDIVINDTRVKYTVWVAEIHKVIDGILGYAGANTFKLNGQPVNCATVELKSSRCCRVVVDKTCIIPPGVETIIPGKVLDLEASPSCAILVPTEQFTERYQLLMAKSVVNAEKNCIPIKVLHLSELSIKMYEKYVAATCEAATVDNEVTVFPYSPTGAILPHLADVLERSSTDLDNYERNEIVNFLIQVNQVFAQDKIVRHSPTSSTVTSCAIWRSDRPY
ncbi:hypothetical protein ACJMK2_027393 [Sinanodonta woodiana]|uniref:Vitellogenin n=1 Tax=Sinanodonta woodiana TaxID=1069815 RepID=A0ABD3XQX3_SINWO